MHPYACVEIPENLFVPMDRSSGPTFRDVPSAVSVALRSPPLALGWPLNTSHVFSSAGARHRFFWVLCHVTLYVGRVRVGAARDEEVHSSPASEEFTYSTA